MRLLRLCSVSWLCWTLWAATPGGMGFYMRESFGRDEKENTHADKSFLLCTLTVTYALSQFDMGGTGRGWACVQVETIPGRAWAWAGTVSMICSFWAGLYLGWVGVIRGRWLVNPFSLSGSHLVADSSLFVWSLGIYFVSLPFCHLRLVVGDHFWSWLLLLGIIVYPGDIRQDWLGGISFRCYPFCAYPPKPETTVGCRSQVSVVFLCCRWDWGLGWVNSWNTDYAISCGVLNVWVISVVKHWALEGRIKLCSRTYVSWKHHFRGIGYYLQHWRATNCFLVCKGCRGILGTSVSVQMKSPKGLRSIQHIHNSFRVKKFVFWAWHVLWSCLVIYGCIVRWLSHDRPIPGYIGSTGVISEDSDMFGWGRGVGWVNCWSAFLGVLGSMLYRAIGRLFVYYLWAFESWKHHIRSMGHNMQRWKNSSQFMPSKECRGKMVKITFGVFGFRGWDKWKLRTCNTEVKASMVVCAGDVKYWLALCKGVVLLFKKRYCWMVRVLGLFPVIIHGTVESWWHKAAAFLRWTKTSSRFIYKIRGSLVYSQLFKASTFCVANICKRVRLLEWLLHSKSWNGVLLSMWSRSPSLWSGEPLLIFRVGQDLILACFQGIMTPYLGLKVQCGVLGCCSLNRPIFTHVPP
ncbi:hypothetical protein HanOQP8_Chr08g0267841 [Helianthus annuus]|nr:hypothetical protein HanOQP8_Chr08g0267841 [Helianthus annuus]